MATNSELDSKFSESVLSETELSEPNSTCSETVCELKVESAVRGYHIYKAMWTPNFGEEFISLHQSGNTHDQHAMGVYIEDKLLVGHLPREMARYCHYFTLHDGTIIGTVSGRRRHSSTAGGMEIPCILTFKGRRKTIKQLKKLLEELNTPSVVIHAQ